MQIPGPIQGSTSSQRRVVDVERALRAEASQPIAYAEAFQPQATVAALDVFAQAPGDAPWHGDYVDSILASGGLKDQDVLKIQHGMSDATCHALGELLNSEGPDTPSQRLEGYIELSASQKLIQTNGTLAQILADPHSRLRVLNQSQGNSRVDIYELLESASQPSAGSQEALSPTGSRLARLVGLDPDAPGFEKLELHQRLADRVSQVVDASALVAGEQRRHEELLQALRDKGVLMVTSAGNNADELSRVRAEGLKVPDSFDDDLTSVGPKIVVGALDASALPGQEQAGIAYFSSRYPNVSLLAPGVEVLTPLGPRTGTSFAAPQVAHHAELLRRQHPEWTVDQLEAETRKSFVSTDGFHILS